MAKPVIQCPVLNNYLCKLFTSFAFTTLLFSAAAQQPVFNWATAFHATSYIGRDNSNGRTVVVDKKGNVFSAGLFEHTIDCDPGPEEYALKAANPSETAIYISKLDANGNFVWAIQLPIVVEFGTIEMKVDGNGNIYLVSDISQEADMDPGPGVHMMAPTGFRDAFVIKLDTDGKLIWVKQFGGPGDTGPQSTALEIDKDNNVIICGQFNNTVDFDPGPGTFNLISSAHFQSFIVKLNKMVTWYGHYSLVIRPLYTWVAQFTVLNVIKMATFIRQEFLKAAAISIRVPLYLIYRVQVLWMALFQSWMPMAILAGQRELAIPRMITTNT